MNTLAKVLLCIVAVLLALKFLPVLAAAVFVTSIAILVIGGLLLGGVGVALAALVVTALVAVTVLSPLWIPVVVVLGVLALIRRCSSSPA